LLLQLTSLALDTNYRMLNITWSKLLLQSKLCYTSPNIINIDEIGHLSDRSVLKLESWFLQRLLYFINHPNHFTSFATSQSYKSSISSLKSTQYVTSLAFLGWTQIWYLVLTNRTGGFRNKSFIHLIMVTRHSVYK